MIGNDVRLTCNPKWCFKYMINIFFFSHFLLHNNSWWDDSCVNNITLFCMFSILFFYFSLCSVHRVFFKYIPNARTNRTRRKMKWCTMRITITSWIFIRLTFHWYAYTEPKCTYYIFTFHVCQHKFWYRIMTANRMCNVISPKHQMRWNNFLKVNRSAWQIRNGISMLAAEDLVCFESIDK